MAGVFISKMSSGTTQYMENTANLMDPAEKLNGLTSGFQGAFTLGLIFIIVALVVSFFLKGQKQKEKATQLLHIEN